MLTLLAIAAAGFIAQLVDGSLGMGYGVTSTTLLLSLGLLPAVASATVHLAEIGASGVSGVAHWRLGNVDGKTLLLLGIPGGVGAFIGAVVLSNLSLDFARPWTSVVLLVLGVVIVAKFIHGRRSVAQMEPLPLRRRWLLTPLGLAGGFLDASGGGGWGPVTTSTLMAAGKMKPRTIIGTVSGSEFIVSVSASVGFLLTLGAAGIPFDVVAMILVGGVIAAPVSALLVRWFDERALGTSVGALIILLNVDRVLQLIGVDSSVGLAARVAVVALSVVIVAWLLIRGRAARRDAAARGAVEASPAG
jgi:uncharacterized membrane protein YfcA